MPLGQSFYRIDETDILNSHCPIPDFGEKDMKSRRCDTVGRRAERKVL